MKIKLRLRKKKEKNEIETITTTTMKRNKKTTAKHSFAIWIMYNFLRKEPFLSERQQVAYIVLIVIIQF